MATLLDCGPGEVGEAGLLYILDESVRSRHMDTFVNQREQAFAPIVNHSEFFNPEGLMVEPVPRGPRYRYIEIPLSRYRLCVVRPPWLRAI